MRSQQHIACMNELGQGDVMAAYRKRLKLLQAWVDEVRRLCVKAEEGSLPRLDLSGLSFVDRAGVELLQQLLRQGVRIHSCSPFVAELLHWDHNPNP